ncbi:hypothetical protein ACSPUS_000609 [Escherichia coli]|uniref:hypothetical protein n=1 Tax=Escherichia coli TaxID=562 RepID=UPI000E077B65|nr:hypothetical protein [Escherichia coli]STN48917.1 Uncharacterised protein [Escherichia coli]HAI2185377.1 hypothetical protein [Escherichia coli]
MKNKLLHWSVEGLAVIFIVIAFSYYFGYAFTNPDSVIYKIIADGIVKHGDLPYTFAFDHKPAFIFYTYALFSLIYPFKVGFFAAFSLLFYLFTGSLISKLATGSFKHALSSSAAVLFFYFPFLDFSGNTEIVYNLYAIASLCLLYCYSAGSRLLFFSGVLAIFAVNTNYMAGVMLSLPTIYLLMRDGLSPTAKRAAWYALGVIAGLAIILLPIAMQGSLISGYFEPQIHFLTSYNESSPGFKTTLYYYLPVLLSILIAPACVLFGWVKRDVPARGWVAFVITTISASITLILTGKEGMHYAAIYFAPVAMLAVAMGRNPVPIVLACSIPFNFYYAKNTEYLFELHNRVELSYTKAKAEEFAAMHQLVGNEKVMSIRASHVLFYLSDMIPFHPYIWNGHSKLVFGDKENEYFIKQLELSPKFVLTGNGYCEKADRMIDVCDMIKHHYTKKMSISWVFGYGGDLYQAK